MSEKPPDTKLQEINLVCFPHGAMHEPAEAALQEKPSFLHLSAIATLISGGCLLAIVNFGTFCILLLTTFCLAIYIRATKPTFKQISKPLALQANERELLFQLEKKKSMSLKWSKLVEIKLTGEPIFSATQPIRKTETGYDFLYSSLILNYSQQSHLAENSNYQIEELKLENYPKSEDRYKFIKFSGISLEDTYYIPFHSIPDRETWKELSTRIKTLAPHVEIDSAISSAFRIPSPDTSFTDI